MAQPRPLRGLRRAVSGRRVFANPVERDGVTVIPAASVIGGGGVGEGPVGGDTSGTGSGGGFGLIARPVGAFVISEKGVRWRPAIDMTGLLGLALVTAFFIGRRLLSDRD